METFRMPDPARDKNETVHSIAAKTALILETNNLRGGEGIAQAVESLKRLVAALSKQTVSPSALAQWIVTHDGLPADACARIAVLAGRSIDFIEIDANTGYYEAKN